MADDMGLRVVGGVPSTQSCSRVFERPVGGGMRGAEKRTAIIADGDWYECEDKLTLTTAGEGGG